MANDDLRKTTPGNAKNVLKPAIQAGVSSMLVGTPGVGKTSIYRQVAKETGMNVIEVESTILDPLDVRGLPVNDGGKAKFLLYSTFDDIVQSAGPTMVIIDDIGNAQKDSQAALMHVVLERRVGSTPIPREVNFQFTTNSQEDNTGVRGIIEALKDRIDLIVHVEPTVDDWLSWATANGIDEKILGFMAYKRTPFKFTPTSRIVKQCTPRGVEKLSGILSHVPLADRATTYLVVESAVGKEFANEFVAWTEVYNDLVKFEDILANPKTTAVPRQSRPACFAIASMLSQRLTVQNFPILWDYIVQMEDIYRKIAVEWGVAKSPALKMTPQYRTFANEHIRTVNDGLIRNNTQ